MEKLNANTQFLAASVIRQYLAGLCVALYGIQYGIFVGWTSPAVFLLTSDQSPLPTGKITTDEAGWTASIHSLGFLMSCPLFGYVGNRFGRKWPLIMLSVPISVMDALISPMLLITWFGILFAQNIYYIYVARFVQGITTAGIFALSQFYFVEICNDRVRGLVSSTVINTSSVGILIAFVLGTYCDYNATPIFSIAIALLFAVLFSFFPETPTFLLKQNKILEAEKSIQFYHNLNEITDIELIEEKIIQLKIQIGSSAKINDRSAESVKSVGKLVKWKDLILNPGRRALIIGIVLALLNHISGNFALINYAATIFKEAGSIISENESAMIIGIILCIGTFLSPFYMDTVSRKGLYVISTIGSTIGFIILGSFLVLKSWHHDVSAFKWIPVVNLPAVIFIQSIAASSASLIVTAELMPESIKEFGITFCNTILGISAFIVLKFMLPLCEWLGLGVMVLCFAVMCLLCGIFIILFMPETRGKSYDEIMKSLQ